MVKPAAAVVPITEEPEIILSPSTQENNEASTGPTEERAESREERAESVYSRRPSRSPSPFREREREVLITNHPTPRPRGYGTRIHEVPNLISTRSLNDFIKLDDVCADTANNQMVYIANYPFAAADLDKISWIFRIGTQDAWVPKPRIVATKEGYKFDFVVGEEKRGRGRYAYDHRFPSYIDDGYDRMGRPGTTITRLGNALRVFKSDEKKYGTENVKFVILVQGKNNADWFKLVVAHSRQAALVEIFHEIICGHSIQFVGAVLKDVVVPMEIPHKKIKFQRVATLKEAQEVEEGVVGVIC